MRQSFCKMISMKQNEKLFGTVKKNRREEIHREALADDEPETIDRFINKGFALLNLYHSSTLIDAIHCFKVAENMCNDEIDQSKKIKFNKYIKYGNSKIDYFLKYKKFEDVKNILNSDDLYKDYIDTEA